jgi:hypothetical protein
MRRPAAVFTIALALGAIILAPLAGARADGREEGPTEIEKCKTISKPGSYKLVNNLVATGDCLVITANFVTIDLAGFTISGGGPGLTAIRATPSFGQLQGIAVRNGSISDFLSGVDLTSAEGSIVEGLRIVGPGGGAVGISAIGIVRGNTVRFIGVTPPGSGVGISATGIVTGNFATENGHGMVIGAGSTVIGNTASFNRVEGITVDCPSNVTDNTAVNSTPGFPNLVLNGNGCNNTNNVAFPFP